MSRSNTFCPSLLHLLLLLSLAVCSMSEARPIAGKQDEPVAPGKPPISSKDEEKSGLQARISAKPLNQMEAEVVGKSDTNLQAESVSWKLPRPKAPNADERFNQLDYDPPRTHPPSHN